MGLSLKKIAKGAGAAAGSITILNSTTAPANGIKFTLKFLGEE